MSEQRFVTFDPQDGPEWFETADEAKAHAEHLLDMYRDDCGDGWDEEVDTIHWGEYTCLGEVVQTKCESAPEGSEFDEYWDFELKSTPNAESEVARLTEELAALREAARIRVTAEEKPDELGLVLAWVIDDYWDTVHGIELREHPEMYPYWAPLPERPAR
jgi:hypothetical protein